MKKNKLKIRENTVVHCPTEESANEVLSIAHKLGYKWCDGNEYVEDNCWGVYKKDTCYNLIEGSYTLIRYYESQRKTIITAEEFIKLHKNNNMETYKVKQEDLIGPIKGFPIEIVQRMVDCQVEQGNKADVSVFQRKMCAGKAMGGFDWHMTKERYDFWNAVFNKGNFDEFWKMYPQKNKKVYYRGDEERGDEIIKALEELGGKNFECFNGKSNTFYYFIGEDNIINGIVDDWLLKQAFTEAFLPELPKKETIKIGEDTYEVTDVKITIAIPTDTILKKNSIKVSYNEKHNEVILTADKKNIYKPRVGDYVTILLADTPIKAIIVGISDSTNLTYIKVSADNGYEVNECYTTPAKINLATPEEKQEIDTILSYWDVIWNPTKYKLEQKRWRAEKLGVYYYVTRVGKVSKTIEGNYCWNNEDYQFGNYFRTEQQAKDKAEQLKKLF